MCKGHIGSHMEVCRCAQGHVGGMLGTCRGPVGAHRGMYGHVEGTLGHVGTNICTWGHIGYT